MCFDRVDCCACCCGGGGTRVVWVSDCPSRVSYSTRSNNSCCVCVCVFFFLFFTCAAIAIVVSCRSLPWVFQMAARTNSREAYKSYSEAVTKANQRVALRSESDTCGK